METFKKKISEKLEILPMLPGVYLMKDLKDKIIYVGKAISLKSRVRSYFYTNKTEKTRILVKNIADLEWVVTNNELEALILECNLIKEHRPKYNVRLKDDKNFPYIKLTMEEEFPRLLLTRLVSNDKARYFGPYTDSQAAKNMVRWLRKTFRLRTCKHLEKKRPCLQYHIKRCLAPCASLISKEEYQKNIDAVSKLLNGQTEAVLKNLKQGIEKAVEKLAFEKAAEMRDQLLALQKLFVKQGVQVEAGERDVWGSVFDEGFVYVEILMVREGKLLNRERFVAEIGMEDQEEKILAALLKEYYACTSFIPKEIIIPFKLEDQKLLAEWLKIKKQLKVSLLTVQKGMKFELLKMAQLNAQEWFNLKRKEKKEILEEKKKEVLKNIESILRLPRMPLRIECFDISHIQGTETVASMVVFCMGQKSKSNYRRFKLTTLQQGEVDDFKAMSEVLQRRVLRFKDWGKPDLIVIDGGKGQLAAVLKIFLKLGVNDVPLVALAKKMEEIYLPGVSCPLVLKHDSKELLLLTKIRNEAHDFAVSYHRKLRDKKMLTSLLDGIKGIGEKRKNDLWKKFKSIEGLLEADIEHIKEVGIDEKTASKLLLVLREKHNC